MNINGFETDKDLSGYIETYQGLAATLPENPAVLELGVYGGGSLAFWKWLFPKAAVVVGVDIDPNAIWPPGTIKIVADQQDPTLPNTLKAVLASEALGKTSYDLIVDDASHQGHLTYKSLQHLWPLLSPGGYYVIEDWCVWNGHHGDRWDLSMLNVAMMLLKMFNTPETEIHFVTYRYGQIIIRKRNDE